jgi:uncharacterized protein (DUF927 family)
MHPSGTWEGWLAAVEAARPFPVVWLPLYAALVPPLMRFLPTLPNFILDLCGSTSQGKTTSLRLAASAWGSPDERDGGLVRSWDNTRVWIERTAAFLGHLPLLLDDTKRARRAEDVGKTCTTSPTASGAGGARSTRPGPCPPGARCCCRPVRRRRRRSPRTAAPVPARCACGARRSAAPATPRSPPCGR